MQGFEKDLDKIPLRPGTFYITVDTGRMFLDIPTGRKEFAFINDVKENNYGKDTIYQIEDQIDAGDDSSRYSGYRYPSGYSDLFTAEY